MHILHLVGITVFYGQETRLCLYLMGHNIGVGFFFVFVFLDFFLQKLRYFVALKKNKETLKVFTRCPLYELL